jgi:S1-C subfamily serine protease
MSCPRFGFTVLAVALAASAPAAEDPKLTKAEVVKRAKPTVAFVIAKLPAQTRPARAPAVAQGSAVCVHPSGLFVTNAHVVENSTDVELVVNPALADQKVFKATVVRKDEKDDLALLRVDAAGELPALPLGDDERLAELSEVIAFGYPFGSALAVGSKEYPSVTVTAGSISSLRKKDGRLELIQLDVALNPGNSGGPVLDLSGKVVGVALGGIKGTQINFAVPVSRVSAFLARPEFSFTPPAVRPADRGKPVRVEARLASFVPDPTAAEVELEVRRGTATTRHAMALANGAYTADVVLLPAAAGNAKCAVEVTFADGALTAQVADREVKVGAAAHKLSEFRTISPAAGRAVLQSGAKLEGKLSGLEAVAVTLGGRETTLDLSAAEQLGPQPRGDEPVVAMEVVARRGGKEIGRVSRSVILNEGNKVYLAELHPSATVPGPWPLGVGNVGNPEAKPITVNGRVYPKGLGLHANDPPATATYRLAKSASVFRTAVSLNDFNEVAKTVPISFEVYGDGKLLWKSKAITTPGQTDDGQCDVTGVDELELRVRSSQRHAPGAHTVWLDPLVVGPDPAAIRRAGAKR